MPNEDGSAVEMVDVWTIILTDRHTLEQQRLSIQKEARDTLIRDLTGGIVLAGGDLPNVKPG